MDHQDWNQVTFTNQNVNKATAQRTIQEKKTGNQMSYKLQGDDIVQIKKYDSAFIKRVKLMRTKYQEINTQDKLAFKLGVHKSIINQLESGTGKYDGGLVNKINQLEQRLEKSQKPHSDK